MSTTDELRKRLIERGVSYKCGYSRADRRVDTHKVTSIWPTDDPRDAITFEEDEDGALWCADSVSVDQAIAAALAQTDGGQK